jgi:hypothetical protein
MPGISLHPGKLRGFGKENPGITAVFGVVRKILGGAEKFWPVRKFLAVERWGKGFSGLVGKSVKIGGKIREIYGVFSFGPVSLKGDSERSGI